MSINRAPFNLLVDDDGSNTVGTVWGKQDIKDVILDPIDALPGVSGVWTAYGVFWTGGDGTQPVLGNGLISGRYQQIGKWIDVAIVLQMGSTTTYGTSSYWQFSLPFAPKFVTAAGQEVTLRVGALTGAGAAQPGITAYVLTGTTMYLITGAGGLVNPTTPFTWSTNAVLSIRGSYELP